MKQPKKSSQTIHSKINKNINQRYSQIQIQKLIKEHIVPMLSRNMTFGQICEELRGITNKSSSQCERYVKRAIDELSKDFDRDLHTQRIEAVTALRGDLTEAYTNYQTAEQDRDRVSWWKEYQSIKKRISELSPNELKSEIKTEDEQTININFGKVTDE